STLFKPTDDQGQLLQPDELPLVIALTQHRPAHRGFWIRGLDARLRHIEVVAFPLQGLAGRFLGAIAIFWEAGP
ncbi:MAG: PAS domain-containing protein, partial [Anaerolineales bacterium]